MRPIHPAAGAAMRANPLPPNSSGTSPCPVHSDARVPIRTDLEISEFPRIESPEKDGQFANSPPKQNLSEWHNARFRTSTCLVPFTAVEHRRTRPNKPERRRTPSATEFPRKTSTSATPTNLETTLKNLKKPERNSSAHNPCTQPISKETLHLGDVFRLRRPQKKSSAENLKIVTTPPFERARTDQSACRRR